jgi:hypothetical protein
MKWRLKVAYTTEDSVDINTPDLAIFGHIAQPSIKLPLPNQSQNRLPAGKRRS